MNNDELLQEIIKENHNVENGEELEQSPLMKFLVFSIEDNLFAVNAEEIREIVLDVPVFFIPFVPSYVRGFINRHGEPYTVIDLNVLFQQKLLDSSTFIILSDRDNPAAFMINEVIEILKIRQTAVRHIAESESSELYISGSLTSGGGKEILIISIPEIFKRLERDVEG